MNQAAYEIVDRDGEARLRLTGDWTTTALGRLPTELSRDLEGRDIASIDTSDLGRFDTAGALALVQASSGRLSKSQWKERPEAGRIYHMIELLEHLGAERAIWVGHDWGAPVAWHCALLRPDVFTAVAGLSVPFQPRRPKGPPTAAMAAISKRAGLGDLYISRFQAPDAHRALDADPAMALRGWRAP